MAIQTITFDTYDMQTSAVISGDIDDGQPFERQLNMRQVLGKAGAIITNEEVGTKIIPVKGMLLGTSQANCDAMIDTFNQHMMKSGKNLDLGYAGSTRRYVCTPRKARTIRPHRGSYWADFEVEFEATEYGKDTTTTTIQASSANTSASRTIAATVGGSAKEQLLRFQITVTAATGLTTKTIGIENDTTGELLTVTRTWVVGDVLIVDIASGTVQVNGVDVDFNGPLMRFEPGAHNILITNDFTTRTLTTVIDYIKRYA